MISEFEYVDLIFENCNYVRIPSEYVRFLNLEEITTSIWTNIIQQYTEVRNCRKFEIELDLKALQIKTHFENEFGYSGETFEDHLSIFGDITCVEIKTNVDKEFCIGVPWKSADILDTMNLLQKTEFRKNIFSISCTLDNLIKV